MKSIMKKMLGCVGLLCMGLSYAQTAPESTLKRIKEEKKIRIGYREGSSPFSFNIPDVKRPVGYTIDICLQTVEAVKRHLSLTDVSVEWLAVDYKQRFTFLDSGQIDLECGATTNTAERRKKHAFSVPYYIAGIRMLVRSESKIKFIENLIGKTVAATKGTTGIAELKRTNENRVLNLNIIEADSDEDGIQMLANKKVDAVFNDDILLASRRSEFPEPKDYAVEGEFMSVEPYGIMMRQDPEFNRVINRELVRMALAKEIDALYTKWFLQKIPPKGLILEVPMGHLLRDSLKFPSDRIP